MRAASVICSATSRWFVPEEMRHTSAGKDTGRYWDAGAANVHWVIATDAQLGKASSVRSRGWNRRGVRRGQQLRGVGGTGLYVHGEGATEDVRIKKSARSVIARTTPIYVTHIYDELPALIDRVRDIVGGEQIR
jgi:hypothetical protein